MAVVVVVVVVMMRWRRGRGRVGWERWLVFVVAVKQEEVACLRGSSTHSASQQRKAQEG